MIQMYGGAYSPLVAPELTSVDEACRLFSVSRSTFYKTVRESSRPVRRWRKAGDRRILFDLRQLRPLFTPRPVES